MRPRLKRERKGGRAERGFSIIGNSINSLPILMQCSIETQGVYSLTAECFTIRKLY